MMDRLAAMEAIARRRAVDRYMEEKRERRRQAQLERDREVATTRIALQAMADVWAYEDAGPAHIGPVPPHGLIQLVRHGYDRSPYRSLRQVARHAAVCGLPITRFISQ